MAVNSGIKVARKPNVMVPMRDGVKLATDVFRPDVPGRYPVLVTRGPYSKDGYVENPDHSIWFFAKHGYVVVSQDCRARFESEGADYNPGEGRDPTHASLDSPSAEWLARRSWGGNVAHFR